MSQYYPSVHPSQMGMQGPAMVPYGVQPMNGMVQPMPYYGNMAQPMVGQVPMYNTGYHNPYSFGNRVRRFFGLAPDYNIRYKSRRGCWGFMGYSSRPRYFHPSGYEVDREGRQVIRV